MLTMKWLGLALLTLALVGCGGSREKGKNADLDRPTPATGR